MAWVYRIPDDEHGWIDVGADRSSPRTDPRPDVEPLFELFTIGDYIAVQVVALVATAWIARQVVFG